MGASSWVVRTLREGFRLQFHRKPFLSQVPICPTGYRNEAKDQLVGEQIDLMLRKEAVEVVPGPYPGEGYYSRIFLVQKSSGKWRPVIDLKRLNKSLVVPRFKMESITTVWNSLIPGNYTFSIDLTDAYFHIPIFPGHRKYLRFVYQGVVYQFKALPFGLSSAPWIFTKVMTQVKAMVHIQGVMLLLYLDDWLVQIGDYNTGTLQSSYMVELCHRLGLLVNSEKSELVPKQQFQFIGGQFDLLNNRVYPKEQNMTKLLQVIEVFLTSSFRTAREYQSLLGLMGSQDRYIQWARLERRVPQRFLLDNWNQFRDSQDVLLPVPPHVKEALLWWKRQHVSPLGVPLVPPQFTHRVFTDASTKGWGAHSGQLQCQGLWSMEEQQLHINLLEMRAVRLALQQLRPQPCSRILVSSDNNCVVAYINKEGGTRSRSLMAETGVLFNLVRSQEWTLKASYIPGRLNVIADQLSRQGQVLPSEWSLHQEAADMLFSTWGKPLLDLFATKTNKKCLLYVSPVPDPQALGVDALTMDLEGVHGYAYPPHQILSKFLQKVQLTSKYNLIVVAPYWPNQPWFPVLMALAEEDPIPLPEWENLLRQPHNNMVHLNLSLLDLHAWRLTRDI